VQTRVGRGKKPIRVAKFRTMVVDAERRGPVVTAARDPRITRVGALLRKAKLDELPQLWNILRGEMSIVGPRPEVPRYVEKYRPEWQKLLSVRPGLTDLASLTFRDEESLLALAHDRERAYTEVVMPMKLELALRGVEQRNVLFDLAVIARTAAAVVRRRELRDDPVITEARRRIERLNEDA
jgi:lipopolysaccharide/colanic/teichoic acid biosynthesis glycosyltransferase